MKYLGVKCHDICKFANGSAKKIYIHIHILIHGKMLKLSLDGQYAGRYCIIFSLFCILNFLTIKY